MIEITLDGDQKKQGNLMVLRSVSILATVVLMAAAAALVFRGAMLATGPVSISLQLLGLALMIWARLTFGFRSFHYAANPTQGGLVITDFH